jgi:KDO2-lipid IV(A) lauroyltransferase
MKQLNWFIQALFFYLFTLVVAALPNSKTASIGKKTGIFLFNILHSRRKIAVDNIQQSLPFMKKHPSWTGEFETAEEIALATFINLGTSLVEVCRLYHGKGDNIIDSIEVKDAENFHIPRKRGNGVVLIGGHCGNWELMSLSFKKHINENVWAIARQQNNPYLNTIIEKMRIRYGNKVIYKENALKQTLGVIRKHGLVGMLIDQAVFEHNGILIEFLGRKAWANKAPAIIASKTGVSIVPTFLHRRADCHVLTFYPEYLMSGDRTEDGIMRDIQAMSRYLENFICAHPADWYWIHRRWKRAGELL